MTTPVEVLIVGAGPTGLTLATNLAHAGISFCLIDKKSNRTQTSNALGIHARTLELLEDFGLAKTFLAAGKKIVGANLNLNKRRLAEIELNTLPSRFNFVLVLPQCDTEKILEEHLAQKGITPQRNTELVALAFNDNTYQASVIQNGSQKTLTATYVIACDGAHSKVRELCHLPFEGDEIGQPFALADVKAATDLALDKMHVYYKTTGKSKGLFAIFPIHERTLRVIANLGKAQAPPTETDINIKKLTKLRSNNHVTVEQIDWQSHFWIHSKKISKMRKGNVFFAGDAAHIHSPVGGQGMNTGMQDAYNLAWKLKLVITHQAPPALLDSYHEERYPIIGKLVKETDNLTRIMLSKNPLLLTLRNFLAPFLLKRKSINQQLAKRISMLSLHYEDSPIINYDFVISNRSPQPGELVPDVEMLNQHHLKEFLIGNHFWLLIFTGDSPDETIINKIKTLTHWLKSNYSKKIRYHIVTPRPLEALDYELSDEQNLIAKKFNVTRPALCLIRPDKYLCFCTHDLAQNKLERYLKEIFLAPKKVQGK